MRGHGSKGKSKRCLLAITLLVGAGYDMDTFGQPLATTGSTPNPYRFGAAWGYIRAVSGVSSPFGRDSLRDPDLSV
jgi:hypothetical protein